MPEPEQPYRLPRTVVPSRYERELAPDLDAEMFEGVVEVAVEVVEPVTEIVLNANELSLDDASLASADGGRVEVSASGSTPSRSARRSRLAETVEPGPWTIRVAFHAKLNPRFEGFYKSTFTDAEDDLRRSERRTSRQPMRARRSPAGTSRT